VEDLVRRLDDRLIITALHQDIASRVDISQEVKRK
jgi:hypothetical protein